MLHWAQSLYRLVALGVLLPAMARCLSPSILDLGLTQLLCRLEASSRSNFHIAMKSVAVPIGSIGNAAASHGQTLEPFDR